MDEDSFHQKMEGNDWTYYSLFSNKEFLNEDWHNYACIESCAAIGNARHGCESLRTDIQSISKIDDSDCMMTNITGSSIWKSTDHTSQVKPGKLSDRFILSDRELCSDNPSSVFERTSDLEQSEIASEDESEIATVLELEDFQKEQSSRNSRNRYRDRSNSRDRDNSGDSYRNRSRDRGRSNSRENRNNQQRSGSGQRYYDREDICDYSNRTGHPTHECFKLENYLKKQGKRIVLHDNDDIQDIAQAASLSSLPHQVTETPHETNLDGLVLGCRQPSKSDQASDLEEKACLHVVIQVPELNETYLCEGKQETKNDVSQLRILSNMMEKETHVDSTSSGEQADICQTLFDIAEDQSDVHRRAVNETAISGHPQSGTPGTHITTTISDMQSQMVEGNLSLNSPNSCTGIFFHDVYYCLKGKSMDGSGIWSKLSDTSQYLKAEVDSSVTYSFDQKKHQIAALSNKLTDDNISVDKIFNSKKQNIDASNCNIPNVPGIFHHGRTSLYNVYNTLTLTLINNGHYLSIICIA